VHALARSLQVELSDVQAATAAVGSVRPSPGVAADTPAGKMPKVDPKAVAAAQAKKRAEEAKASTLAKQAQGTRSITSFFKPKA